jgi:hypothetical protein
MALFNCNPYVYGLLLLGIKLPNMTRVEFFHKVTKIDAKRRVCFSRV